MKKLLKNPLFYVMYFIPQLIMTHAVSTFNKTFSNGKTCFADYYLHFMIGILMIFCACMK